MEARTQRQQHDLRDAGRPGPSARPERLRIELLGGLRVERAGTPLALPRSKRTRALLAYLAATGHAQPRAHLCDLLWDGPDDPRAELRWSLSKLRPVIDAPEAPTLDADREQVGLRADAITLDLAPLRPLVGARCTAIDADTLEAAAATLAGEFLAGLELPGCHRFHQWCMAEREAWSRLRLTLLAELVRRLGDRPERALPHARAWVGADPYAEPAHTALLHALLALGRTRDAQAHARQLETLFERELGVAPAGALRDAIGAVERDGRRQQGVPSAPPPPPIAPAADDEPASTVPPHGGGAAALPFVGRDRECQAIAQAVDSLRAAQPRPLLLFLGEPGIGKTRLIDVLADRAGAAGARVLRARCFEAEMSRPYGAWIDALRDAPSDVLAEPLRAELAPLRPLADVSAFGRSGDRTRLFEIAAAWLDALAALQPLVLLLDDLQWLDEASAALLHYVVRSADGKTPLLFAAAARDGELDDNAATRTALHSLDRDARLCRLTVDALGVAEIAALLVVTAPDADAEATHRASGGNPWFALALARVGHDRRDQRQRAAAGTDAARHALAIEPLLRVDAALGDVLACAAVMGRECRAELLAEVLAVDELELAQRLARLERRHLLRAAPDGRFDYAHDLMREAVYARLPPAQRRAMQRRIVRALQSAVGADPGLYGELAHHAIETEQHALAVSACIAAARHCLRVYANAQALSLADRAAPSLERMPPQQPGRVVATIELIELRILASAASPSFGARVPGWVGELQGAVQAAQEAGERQAAANGLHLLAWLAQQCNDIGATREATLRAELMSRGGDAAARCLQLANTGRCLMEVESDLPRARELIDTAGALAQAQSLQVIELEWARGLIARWDGDWDAAQRLVRSAVTMARARQDRWREFECLNWLATIQFERERWDEVATLGAEIVEVAGRAGGGLAAPFAEALRALAAWAAQGPTAPSAPLRRAVDAGIAHLRSVDDKAHLAYALNQLAALELACDRREAAGLAAAQALTAAQAVRRATEIATARALLARAGRTAVEPANDEAVPAELSARARGMHAPPGARAPSP